MKKLTALLAALCMTLLLAACGGESIAPEDQQITLEGDLVEYTKGADDQAGGPSGGGNGAAYTGLYRFAWEGVEIVPGASFDASELPDALSVYQVPSCALVGTDNLYNYELFEVTAFNEGNGEFVYSIYFMDPNLTTPEGLALGDSLEKAISIYGSAYADDAGECVFTREKTQLRLIVENNTVVSIEYRMVT